MLNPSPVFNTHFKQLPSSSTRLESLLSDDIRAIMEPTRFFDEARVIVSAETYAILKSKEAVSDAFATVWDENETTVVVAEDGFDEADARDVEYDWKRFTFEAVLPFDLVGFLAAVSSALAAADVSIFVLSAYSTDHVLVKREDVPRAARALEELGCDVVYA